MDTTLAISLSNQLALRRKMDVIANNVANMSTTGFKREVPIFAQYLVEAEATDVSGSTRTVQLKFVEDSGLLRDFSGGELVRTASPLDIGIEGEGFFTVQTPDGERFTRNGNFRLDADGRLVTSDGHPVLSDGGAEITVSPEDAPMLVAEDGTISTRAGILGKFAIAVFPNPAVLEKVGANLYSASEPPEPAAVVHLMQGTLERANVQPVLEMTEMIEVMRAYQHASELVQAGEEMERRAVQRLGEPR